MDRKLSVVANVKYQSSKAKGAARLKSLLRYFQYRNDKTGHIPQHFGLERWIDKGLGNNFQTIAANCEAFKSPHVQGFTLVFNPNPDLIEFVPEDQRESFVQELTEATIEQFFAARALDVPEYSYCLHRRETTDGGQPGRDNPHAHLILPGTYDSWADGERLPLYINNNRRENHIEMLHEIAQDKMADLMQRYVGLDWEARYDQMQGVLETPQPEPAAPVDETELTPHAYFYDPDGRLCKAWVATQGDLDPAVKHVGFLTRYEGENVIEERFAALMENFAPEEADILADYLLDAIRNDPENGFSVAVQFAKTIGDMDADARAELFQPAPQTEEMPVNNGIDLDLYF